MTAIEREHHAMNLELALAAHRDLRNSRRVTAVSHELRDAAMHAGGQRLAVIGFLRCRVEYGEMFRMLAHEGAAEFQRIFTCCPRDFLDEAFHVHALLVGVHAAPRT